MEEEINWINVCKDKSKSKNNCIIADNKIFSCFTFFHLVVGSLLTLLVYTLVDLKKFWHISLYSAFVIYLFWTVLKLMYNKKGFKYHFNFHYLNKYIYVVSFILLIIASKYLYKKYSNNYTIFFIALLLHTIYEIKDIYLNYFNRYTVNDKNTVISQAIYENTWINSLGDTIGAIIGIIIIIMLKDKISMKYLYLLVIFLIFVLAISCSWFSKKEAVKTISNTRVVTLLFKIKKYVPFTKNNDEH